MLHLTLLAAALALAAPAPDTTVAATSDTAALTSTSARAPSTTDTVPVRRRPRAVEVSEGYDLRLRIHRYASYTMIPLFVVQTIAGNQLYQSGGSDPAWARSVHSLGAGGLAAVFGVNTVTGLWNLYESRGTTEGRGRRWLHSGLMLAADAGFTYAGVKLGPDATRSRSVRDEHRRIAYISMGSALAGYGVMLFGHH